MNKLKKRIENPSPQIKYSEINIPDQNKIGTGFYITAIKPNYLYKKDPIFSIMYNPPIFQISVNINPSTQKIPVMLGRIDPISSKIFLLPEKIPMSNLYVFKATFRDWKILELSMNGKPLEIINYDRIQATKENTVPSIDNIKFFEKHMELLKVVFSEDFFSNIKNETHPAYIRRQLCKNIIEQKGIIKYPEQKDEILLIGRIILDSLIHIILSDGNIQDIKFGIKKFYGDKNVLKKIESRIINDKQFEDLMVELYFASWHKGKNHTVILFEEDGYPDMKINIPNYEIPIYAECKNVQFGHYKRLNSILKKANKQLKKVKEDCYGIVILDISQNSSLLIEKDDSIPSSIKDIIKDVSRILTGKKNKSISEAILIWNDCIIKEQKSKFSLYFFRKRYYVVKPKEVDNIKIIPKNIQVFDGNTIMIRVIWKPRVLNQ